MTKHCRIWDGESMYYFPHLALQPQFATVWLEDALVLINRVNPLDQRRYEPTSPWELMLSVGQPDRQGTLLYEQDIVQVNQQLWVVQPDLERCGYQLVLAHSPGFSLSLDRLLAKTVRIVGNCLEDSHLILQEGVFSLT
ncbi:YopX family protein [Spirosoma endbachense]|uniref:YopX protein domain-containing protein n=1 Tax=Spirosoma endbachense TaxID=2666025 RepID=A0A6P1VZM4_9BACT|nr:YopX family protein [Spirosoma endbachense]QHV97768.1 hypothetical protein GJR95_23385 [Spirosoma endbachense]